LNEEKEDMNKRKLTWGPNDNQSRLGPFHSLCVADVGNGLEPKQKLALKKNKNTYK
jgi:hypothetical protein